MYCRNCGTEIDPTVRFCPNCGINQDPNITSSEPTVDHSILVKQATKKVKETTMHFLNKPFFVYSDANPSLSCGTIPILAIYALLFALVGCINVTQILNFLVESSVDALISVFPMDIAIPDFQIPTLFDMFMPLVLCALFAAAMEFAGLYLVVIYHKQKPQSIFSLLNVIAIANIVIIVGAVANLLIGIIVPVMTIAVFLASIIIHVMFIYNGAKKLLCNDVEPIWSVGIVFLAICIVFTVTLLISWDNALSTAISSLTDYASSLLLDSLSIFS